MSEPFPTVEGVKARFPHQTLPHIMGRPTYARIKELYRKALENPASITTTRGGGKLGYTALGMTPQFYTTISTTPWTNPTDPGELVYPMGASGELIKRMDVEHNKKRREWLEIQAVDTALKNQVWTQYKSRITRP